MRSSLKILLFIALTFLVANLSVAKPESRLKGPKGVDYGAMGKFMALCQVAIPCGNWAINSESKMMYRFTKVMVAVLKKNPQAFEFDNLNGLKDGEYLKIPSHAEVKGIDRKYAKQRADADDKLWADKLAGKFTENKRETLLSPIEGAKQIDVKVAKQEIEKKLEAAQVENIEKLNSIQVQFDSSKQTVENVLSENKLLQDKITALGEQLLRMQEELLKEREIRQAELALLEQVRITSEQNLTNTTALVEETTVWEEFVAFAKTTLGMIIISSSILILLLVLVAMKLRNRNKPKASEQESLTS
ncbi:FimV/HubP family polar landmark protein [Psychrosphaera algicola]|uniref:TIGR04211 family SH3 domain-containing protein n=1 Tax=Psychrosphaera algicola TaxID=3023714 RepID=A0ABT5FJS1_9GAMM|nr:FimV/HubP family polar landmark protein [Psychrosphaera sp. G1-22]MDC2891447.1 hypothetical protein [Psychrosphaera sp. G1-22]